MVYISEDRGGLGALFLSTETILSTTDYKHRFFSLVSKRLNFKTPAPDEAFERVQNLDILHKQATEILNSSKTTASRPAMTSFLSHRTPILDAARAAAHPQPIMATVPSRGTPILEAARTAAHFKNGCVESWACPTWREHRTAISALAVDKLINSIEKSHEMAVTSRGAPIKVHDGWQGDPFRDEDDIDNEDRSPIPPSYDSEEISQFGGMSELDNYSSNDEEIEYDDESEKDSNTSLSNEKDEDSESSKKSKIDNYKDLTVPPLAHLAFHSSITGPAIPPTKQLDWRLNQHAGIPERRVQPASPYAFEIESRRAYDREYYADYDPSFPLEGILNRRLQFRDHFLPKAEGLQYGSGPVDQDAAGLGEATREKLCRPTIWRARKYLDRNKPSPLRVVTQKEEAEHCLQFDDETQYIGEDAQEVRVAGNFKIFRSVIRKRVRFSREVQVFWESEPRPFRSRAGTRHIRHRRRRVPAHEGRSGELTFTQTALLLVFALAVVELVKEGLRYMLG